MRFFKNHHQYLIVICLALLTIIMTGFITNLSPTSIKASDFKVDYRHHHWWDNKYGYWVKISHRRALFYMGNYRREHHIRIKRHKHKRIRRKMIHKRSHRRRINTYSNKLKQASTMNNQTAQDARDAYINGTNQARVDYGLKPLKVNLEDQRIANARAGQIYDTYYTQHLSDDNDVHGIHMSKAINDANRLGYRDFRHKNIAENCGGLFTGIGYWDNGHYYSPNYDDTNGTQMGNNLANQQVNYDQGENNGHRINILNPVYKYIGASADYNQANGNGSLVEELSD